MCYPRKRKKIYLLISILECLFSVFRPIFADSVTLKIAQADHPMCLRPRDVRTCDTLFDLIHFLELVTAVLRLIQLMARNAP